MDGFPPSFVERQDGPAFPRLQRLGLVFFPEPDIGPAYRRGAHAVVLAGLAERREGLPEVRRHGRQARQVLKLGDGFRVALVGEALQVNPARRGGLALALDLVERELRLGEG